MTEETRSELRRGIEAVVRAIAVDHPVHGPPSVNATMGYDCTTLDVDYHHESDKHPPLTTAQQLALSVLVGEPDRVVLSALCDLLIDQGHEYAVAVAEKARREERERIAGLIRAWADDAYNAGESEQSEMLTALVEVVEE